MNSKLNKIHHLYFLAYGQNLRNISLTGTGGASDIKLSSVFSSVHRPLNFSNDERLFFLLRCLLFFNLIPSSKKEYGPFLNRSRIVGFPVLIFLLKNHYHCYNCY